MDESITIGQKKCIRVEKGFQNTLFETEAIAQIIVNTRIVIQMSETSYNTYSMEGVNKMNVRITPPQKKESSCHALPSVLSPL